MQLMQEKLAKVYSQREKDTTIGSGCFNVVMAVSQTASAQWKLDSLASEQQREKEEFMAKQTLLEQQLSHAREECR